MNILKGKRILISGKGGSGKSIFTSLLTKVLGQKGFKIAILDADPSYLSGLPRLSLGMNNGPKQLIEFIKENPGYELNGQQLLPENVVPFKIGEIPAEYYLHHENTWLFQLGEMHSDGLNMKIFSWILNHFNFSGDFVVLIDSIAGIENYDLKINSGKDIFLILVSPEYESLLIAEKIFRFSKEKGMENVWALLNDFQSDKMVNDARKQLKSRGIDLIGTINYDDQIREAAYSGSMIPDCEAIKATRTIVLRMVSEMLKRNFG